jgi:hypothetical protein
MVRPKGGSVKKTTVGQKRKQSQQEFDEGDDQFFLGSDNEAGDMGDSGDDEERQEEVETAEEKRLRLGAMSQSGCNMKHGGTSV